ncbi:FecR family protein [uncultured Polaribacter sp.]|uniref:FecR family protein n=1 Tax=uncultured Polaribacter sp. TaxID=174711 RepID=UPI00262EEE26|nr:FecR family protein [uncultured Polaribacter sp.]
MSIFNEIVTLTKQVAASILKKEPPVSLDKSVIFDEDDKKYIVKNLTDKSIISARDKLKSEINREEDWHRIKPKSNIPTQKLYWQYAAAAFIAGILSITFFFKDSLFNNESKKPIISNLPIQPGTDKATLTLEDGTNITLTEGTKHQTQNAESNGERIVYNAKQQNKKKIVYNYLTIPRGGQFQVTLSDGTHVWLNSESQLKYPVSFTEGISRSVALIYGEAYFDVSSSKNHRNTRFQVLNKDQVVEVLGTEFNIKAYKDETNIYTTLVEGKVAISYSDKRHNLIPNQQANYNLKKNMLKISTIDVYNETSWKDGVFSFEDKSLKKIMKVLSRWYDVEVVFKNKAVENEEFIGNLRKTQNLNEILETIKNFRIIKDYKISNKTITLK